MGEPAQRGPTLIIHDKRGLWDKDWLSIPLTPPVGISQSPQVFREEYMALSDHDSNILKELSKARQEHKMLTTLLDFYYDLYLTQFRFKAEIPQTPVRDDLGRDWRLQGGIPLLGFEQLGIEPGSFEQLVLQIVEVLHRHNPTWQIDTKPWSQDELLALAREIFETWDTLVAPGPDIPEQSTQNEKGDVPGYPSAYAVGLALAPYLQQAAEANQPLLNLDLWNRGYCPVCGGQPNFALLDQERGGRHLLCSRCSFQWEYPRLGCPFCSSEKPSPYHPSEDGTYRLYVCAECKRYLKTVDLRLTKRVIWPEVERLLTVGMDLSARQEGYVG